MTTPIAASHPAFSQLRRTYCIVTGPWAASHARISNSIVIRSASWW
jgi:hypothetical protein